MGQSALLQYLSPCFFSLLHYLANHKKFWVVLSLITVPGFFVSPILCLHPRCFSSPLYEFRILKRRALEILQSSYALVHLRVPEPRVASVRNMREQAAMPTAKPWFWYVFSRFCLHSALAECIWAAHVSFAGLQGGGVNHVTFCLSRGDVMKISSGSSPIVSFFGNKTCLHMLKCWKSWRPLASC